MKELEARPAESFDFQEILYRKADWVATVTINRPEVYNAYSTKTLAEMIEAFKDASRDDKVAVLVLTGAGEKAFCTGGDVKEYQSTFLRRPHDYWKWMAYFIEAIDLLRNLGKPAIARLNGIVAGGGNELNLACDLAVAADHVTIRQVGTKVGSVACGGATQWLPITIGDRRAREMLFTCEPISAQTALEWGLVNRVVPAEELETAVLELVDAIARSSAYTVATGKAAFYAQIDRSEHDAYEHCQSVMAENALADDAQEGMGAFLDKRRPVWREP